MLYLARSEYGNGGCFSVCRAVPVQRLQKRAAFDMRLRGLDVTHPPAFPAALRTQPCRDHITPNEPELIWLSRLIRVNGYFVFTLDSSDPS